jgi:hypothetical protein
MRQMTQQMTVSGNSPYTLTFPEAAGQTFERGAPVVLNASGQAQEAATPAASVCGVAAMPATGVTGNNVIVWVANDDTLFGIPMAGGIAADRGKLVTVSKTGALWAADRTTVGTFMVLEIGLDIPGNTTYARGKFLESATQLMHAA